MRVLALITLVALLTIALLAPSTALAGERFKPLGPDWLKTGPEWLQSGLYAGKLTGEVEDCFCPEQLVVGFQVTRFIKLGFSRTKMPMVADERDEEQRIRRYGGMVMFVLPF